MRWISPISFVLKPTLDTNSFKTMPSGVTGLPLAPHPGAFGVPRKHHIHEGIDLYVPEGTPVHAVESGKVICVRPFKGPELGHDWWLPTFAVCVEGASGVVLYGEVATHVTPGQSIKMGELLGVVLRVLRKDKGRPMSMMHLELRTNGNTANIVWNVHASLPADLRDPTPLLLECASLTT